MAFVKNDEVEEIIGQLLKPAVASATLKLLNVGNDDVCLFEVVHVAGVAPNLNGLGIGGTREHSAFLIEHLPVRRVKVCGELGGDIEARSCNERPVGSERERRQRDCARLPAANRQDDTALALGGVRRVRGTQRGL